MKVVILIKYLPPTKTRGGRYRATYHGYVKCTVSANQSVLPRQNIAAATANALKQFQIVKEDSK